MRRAAWLALAALLLPAAAPVAAPVADLVKPVVDLVTVDKSERVLRLMSHGHEVARFRVALGGSPLGAKQREGDHRTPEGRYVLDFRKRDSAYFRALHVSYPNAADRQRARQGGVSPGSSIMIHGQKSGFGHLSAVTQRYDWTDGCIALSNQDMRIVWDLVRVPTPVEITP